MARTLGEIVARLGGRLVGDPATAIVQVGTLENAGPDRITFLANPRYRSRLAGCRAGAVILAPADETLTQRPRIVTENPYAYFACVAQLLNPVDPVQPGVHPAAHVAPSVQVHEAARIDAGAVVGARCRIGARAWVGAGCALGDDVVIGEDARLYPSVVVYAGCRIGARTIVHSGAVIGADGFGIAREGERWLKIPQIGAVVIGDDVEIGACTTIDRGAIEDTVIEDGVKLDNHIQIGHNCRVGAHAAIAGCAALAGSAKVGRGCTIGAGSLVLGHLSVCDGTDISADTVVTRSIRRPGTYTGLFPFDEHRAWSRNAALLRQLAELAERVRALERRFAAEGDGHD